MTTTQRVIVQQNNDETLQATVQDHDSSPSDNVINITGMQLDFYIKSAPLTPDTDPGTVHLSTATGEITLTDPVNGSARIFVARAHLQNAGSLWYRLDVLSGGQLKTAGNGDLVVAPQ
jgi:hypothetical protein